MTGLDTPLTPLRFLQRAAAVHPDATAIVDGPRRLTYGDVADIAARVARTLRERGLRAGESVAFLTPNSAEALIAHFAVPLAGGVLVALNTRLSTDEVSYVLEHSRSRYLFADAELLAPVLSAEALPAGVQAAVVLPDADGGQPRCSGAESYSSWLDPASDEEISWEVADETATIAINYTSGTTGKPKGVMYTHRGAYLAAMGAVLTQGLSHESRYLWTLPMFHCNGWCTTWAVTAVAGVHVCLRAVRGDDIWRLIDAERVDRLAGAPTVLSIMADAAPNTVPDQPISMVTAGAPPSPTIIARMEELGISVVHVYGLTETYGPYSICESQPGWAGLDVHTRSRLLARQGVGMVTADDVRVVRRSAGAELADVPADGVTMGEIVMRGNTVMKGYFRDDDATADAFRGGWFHSGDLGVMHADGYVQLLDRAKDVVVSGGENISTVEVEQALLTHEAVRDVAVIGVPDVRWGERPKAFVVLAAGVTADEQELIEHTRSRIAKYKAPAAVTFLSALPHTSTGKVCKAELREREWAGHAARIQG
ncbi:AMP-binding protein [Rhodococcus sp. D2-41]|uniref:AMP-binding protein n=1 Tax=Speluncibacter jeojiensis TaxID=2710754 RepID=UPI00241076D2|nr:AMP-binding protein [Rhodococcus sp. D2-41]MDG3011078.1 AMP-binding protein [Rhodococcus sp. D2-41]